MKLYGFNNLTKNLNLCIYDICYTNTDSRRNSYIFRTDKQYNTTCLIKLLSKVCSIIGANILNIASQDYTPQGASVTILVSEESTSQHFTVQNNTLSNSIIAHLDKSHICVHTYPENHPDSELSTFRIDIEVSTCGIISPLKSLNYLIKQLDPDIVTIDYRIRGFTRDLDGTKHFIDHEIVSIQNFIAENVKLIYNMTDINVCQNNIFHTRMLIKNIDLKRYLFDIEPENITLEERKYATDILWKEMYEIYCGYNVSTSK